MKQRKYFDIFAHWDVNVHLKKSFRMNIAHCLMIWNIAAFTELQCFRIRLQSILLFMEISRYAIL